MLLDDERLRVYVAFRDAEGVGRVGYVDVAADDPRRVLAVAQKPVLDVGAPGMFDDSGVTPLSIVRDGRQIRLYYAGWQLATRVRYFLFMGLAISEDGGDTFTRYARVPILDRSDAEPLMRSSAHVRHAGDRWQMWYAAGDTWIRVGGKDVPSYEVRYIESADGLRWPGQGETCLRLESEDEYGFGRPFIVDHGDHLAMWYSIRSRASGYRLGYAESLDEGRTWVRRDDRAGIDVSPEGWDKEMLGLACVQDTAYGTFLLYNGNGFGETGFGVAVATQV